MASASALAMAFPATATAIGQRKQPLAAASGLRPVSVSAGKPARYRHVQVQASMKEKVVSMAMAATLTVPEVTEAAGPGASPSLKNFLLSIIAGGVVLTVIVGMVFAVSNFDLILALYNDYTNSTCFRNERTPVQIASIGDKTRQAQSLPCDVSASVHPTSTSDNMRQNQVQPRSRLYDSQSYASQYCNFAKKPS